VVIVGLDVLQQFVQDLFPHAVRIETEVEGKNLGRLRAFGDRAIVGDEFLDDRSSDFFEPRPVGGRIVLFTDCCGHLRHLQDVESVVERCDQVARRVVIGVLPIARCGDSGVGRDDVVFAVSFEVV